MCNLVAICSVAVVISVAPVVSFADPDAAAEDRSLPAAIATAVGPFLESASSPTFLGVGRAVDDLADPPSDVFTRIPGHVYPVSKVVSVTPRGGVQSTVSTSPGEIIFVDVLRIEQRRCYILVHTYRNGLNGSTTLVTLVPINGEQWLLASTCTISTS